MRPGPEDIVAEDSEFFTGLDEELRNELDPQHEDFIGGAEYFEGEGEEYDEGEDTDFREPGLEYEYYDESLQDIDFSQFRGDFKSSLKKLDRKLKTKRPKPVRVPVRRKKKKPLTKVIPVNSPKTLHGDNTHRTIDTVQIPRDRQVLIQGANKLILSNDAMTDVYKNIGYCNGKKLRELFLVFNNNSANDFTLELFNPSMPMDWHISTSGNLNNMIEVAGGNAASYTDVLHYILANPTKICNARFVVTGPSVAQQQNEAMMFTAKNIKGEQFVYPLNMSSNMDTMQFQSGVINMDIQQELGRPYIPDGMEVIQYTVYAGNTVTMCFYYEQKLLRHLIYGPDAKKKLTVL